MSFKFYDYLKIPRDSSHTDIKKAFRKLAVEHHPDKGGDPEVFKNISQAYEVLSDPEKRNMYDMSGGNEDFAERQSYHHSGMTFNDIFTGIFKNVGKKRNSHIIVELTLEEVYNGCNKKLHLELEKPCVQCSKSCQYCSGTGMEQMKIQLGPFMQIINQPCSKCNGSRTFHNSVGCLSCKGTSKIIEKIEINIDIPAGITEKHNIIKQGLGEQPTNSIEKPGDLIINFKYKQHHIFEVENDNLIYKLNVSFIESIIGKTLIISHFSGDITVDLSDYGILQNKNYIIRHKGLPSVNNTNKGDLILKVNVSYPYNRLTQENKDKIKSCISSIYGEC